MAAKETSIFQNWPYFNNYNRHLMAEIQPIRRKTPINGTKASNEQEAHERKKHHLHFKNWMVDWAPFT